MSSSFSKKIELETSFDNLNEIIEETFSNLRWRFQRNNNNFYQANINMGFKSWGEDFSVNIISSKELFIKSKLKFGLVDWGKNQNNVRLFEQTFLNNSKYNSINKEAKAIDENIRKDSEDTFLAKLTKLNKLFVAQILTKDEFQDKKKELISNFDSTECELSKEDFLLSLIKFKTNNILTQDDIILIKNKLTDRG